MKSIIFFLTLMLEKYTIVLVALFFCIKLAFVAGQEFGDYNKLITENGSGNVIYLEDMPKQEVVYFRNLTNEFIKNMKDNKDNTNVVSKFQEKLDNLSNKGKPEARHQTLLLITASLISIKSYAVEFDISDKNHLKIKELLPSLNKISTEYSGSILQRNGEMYIPNFLEALSFLQPEYGKVQLRLEKEKLDSVRSELSL